MMERMIYFLNDYNDLFSDNCVRDYLVERLKEIQQLRNGYFHKENLSDMDIVKKAREDAFIIYLLLFGSMNTTEKIKKLMGIPSEIIHFELLCDYVSCNCHMSYYFENNGEMVLAIGQQDDGVIYSRDGKATYTGVYFNIITGKSCEDKVLSLEEIANNPKQKIKFDANSVPETIYKGSFIPDKDGILVSGPIKKIWDKGRFLLY